MTLFLQIHPSPTIYTVFDPTKRYYLMVKLLFMVGRLEEKSVMFISTIII